MNFVIKKNDKPELVRPTFTVDDELHSKLNDYELTSLLNRAHFAVILGKPGSGKSSLEISLLQTPKLFKKVFHSILLFCPENSRASIKNNFWGKNLPENQIYDELNIENLRDAYNVAKANANEKLKTLIIMDDVQKKLKDNDIQKLLLEMVANRRHARLCIHLLCQNFYTIPKQVRDSINDIFVFKVSKKEMEKIFDEIVEMPYEDFHFVLKNMYKNKHDFMFIDSDTKRIFSNWDEIVEKDDDTQN